MSQNFDLLQQIEVERETSTATPIRVRAEMPSIPVPQFSPELMGFAQTLFLAESADTPHAVLFCGVDRENGSCQICLELGRLLAACSGHSVCLVDADVHDSRLSGLVHGSRIAVQNDSVFNGCIQIEPNLWIVPADSMDPSHRGVLAETLAHRRKLLELRKEFDFVLINAPGINERSDAGVLGQVVDATILVIEANSTRKAAALRAKKVLQTMNVRLLGTVLNNRAFPVPEGLYSKL